MTNKNLQDVRDRLYQYRIRLAADVLEDLGILFAEVDRLRTVVQQERERCWRLVGQTQRKMEAEGYPIGWLVGLAVAVHDGLDSLDDLKPWGG